MNPKHVVGLVGPESCGKSVLAGQLAAELNCPLVPEMARILLTGQSPPWTAETVEAVARRQMEEENRARRASPGFLVCDTTLVVIQVWMEEAFGTCPSWIREEIARRPYGLHLLLYPDLPWEPDPLREHPFDRHRLFERYREILITARLDFAEIRGAGSKRLANALEALAAHGLRAC
jgi:nicotinamide riboside kinase